MTANARFVIVSVLGAMVFGACGSGTTRISEPPSTVTEPSTSPATTPLTTVPAAETGSELIDSFRQAEPFVSGGLGKSMGSEDPIDPQLATLDEGLPEVGELPEGLRGVEEGQELAPAVEFSLVSAGGFHSCGLRVDESVLCWGLNGFGEADAPSGSFVQVSAGGFHSCGLRVDGSIVCWGRTDVGQADAPSGSFTQLSSGGEHSCGLRSDGSVVCWGSNDSGEGDAPSGSFVQVSSGSGAFVWVAGRRGDCLPG